MKGETVYVYKLHGPSKITQSTYRLYNSGPNPDRQGLDAKGKVQEKLYDAASLAAMAKYRPSGVRSMYPTPIIQTTLARQNCAPSWIDPDFDAGHRAFYYGQVLKIVNKI